MEYRHFDEIDAPVGTVTEAHPSHRLDYRRFASDEVARYHRMQVDVIRAHSPPPRRAQLHAAVHRVRSLRRRARPRRRDLGQLSARRARGAMVRTRRESALAAHRASRLRVVQSRPLSRHVETAVLGDGAAARPGELGAVEPCAAAGHGAPVELGSVRARRRLRVVLPLAAGAVRAGADAGPAYPDDKLDEGGREAQRVAQEIAAVHDAGADADGAVRAPVALVFDYEAKWLFECSRRAPISTTRASRSSTTRRCARSASTSTSFPRTHRSTATASSSCRRCRSSERFRHAARRLRRACRSAAHRFEDRRPADPADAAARPALVDPAGARGASNRCGRT